VRVLLVDDEPNFRAWLGLLMRRLGFTVEVAVDGVAALEMLRGHTFDLLICDYEMPRMNGIDLIREIRETPQLAHQYAVMLTAHEDLDSKVAALTTGYDDFLAKSCTEVEVIAKVIAAKRMLARNRLLSAAANEWQALATRDELTGVATRRTLVDEAARSLAEGRTVGVALLDLDDFKPVNDNFGHLTGDRILRDIGALFISRTRSSDLIARFGGDEFVLLVRDLPLEDLTGAADRLVAEVESLQWTSGDVVFGMKITSGVAHSKLIPNATLDQLLEAADRDLYAKKWLRKHPGARPDLYEYPGRPGAAIVPLPSGEAGTEPRNRVADEN
jgi:diguanylate cyclase (GGDEF)-like protein